MQRFKLIARQKIKFTTKNLLMRKMSFKLIYCFLIGAGFLLNFACKKDTQLGSGECYPNGLIHGPIDSTIIDTTINCNQAFEYNIVEGSLIIDQAEHFLESFIERNDSGMIYKYKPLPGFLGRDEVIIRSESECYGPVQVNGIRNVILNTIIRINVVDNKN